MTFLHNTLKLWRHWLAYWAVNKRETGLDNGTFEDFIVATYFALEEAK